MAFALFLLDAIDRAGGRDVRAQPLCRGVVENIDQQSQTVMQSASKANFLPAAINVKRPRITPKGIKRCSVEGCPA
jgi:hypothetical protein